MLSWEQIRGNSRSRKEECLMLQLRRDEPDYPESDGEPMGETDLHRWLMMDLIGALETYFGRQEQDQNPEHQQVYVSGNILMYYQQGNVKARISPDVLVTLGVPKGPRRIYKVWEEGKAPDFVIEVTSKKTKARDRGIKKALYEALGVKEYLLFDPTSDYLDPRFQVFRYEGGRHVPVLTPEAVGYESVQLGLTFRVVDNQLRIFETRSQRLLPNSLELRLQAQQQSKRAEQASKLADQASKRAEQEARRADQEGARADRLAARLRALGLDPDEG